MIVVVMGVSGAGKSTIGSMLAAELGCAFLEGDALHAPMNVAKMGAGIPLTDSDRQPWLEIIHERMLNADRQGHSLVVACSALKQAYRDLLQQDLTVRWVYLTGSPELIAARLGGRLGHFMKPALLGSQLRTLETPSDAVHIDVAAPVDGIVQRIIANL